MTKAHGWKTRKPTRRQYGYEHQRMREHHMAQLRAVGIGTCAEALNPRSHCVKDNPTITPDMDLNLCHDETGRVVIGLGHADCNRREAARRARALQQTSRLAW